MDFCLLEKFNSKINFEKCMESMLPYQFGICKVRVIQKVSEVRFLDFLCYNMIAHGQRPLKNFEFLYFEFPYHSYGVFSFFYFCMVGFA